MCYSEVTECEYVFKKFNFKMELLAANNRKTFKNSKIKETHHGILCMELGPRLLGHRLISKIVSKRKSIL